MLMDILEKCVEKEISIYLSSGKVFRGKLFAYDYCGIHLTNVIELTTKYVRMEHADFYIDINHVEAIRWN